jgi:hypothetical protein
LIFSAIIIALLASIIELPCTAGFPVIWNAMAAEKGIGIANYLALLILYLFMYVLIEMTVVIIMVITLSKMHMNLAYGRSLKLISGLLMAYLSVLLILGNEYLNSTAFVIGGSAAVITVSVAAAFLLRKRILE